MNWSYFNQIHTLCPGRKIDDESYASRMFLEALSYE